MGNKNQHGFSWEEEYEVLEKNFTDGTLVVESKSSGVEYLGREMVCSDGKETNEIKRLIEMKLNSKDVFVTKLLKVHSNEDLAYCSSEEKVHLLFEKPRQTLREEILGRKFAALAFSDEEADIVLESGAKAIKHLKAIGHPHGNISTSSLFIDAQRRVILGDPWITPPAYCQQINKNAFACPSPEKILFQNDQINEMCPYRSDLFALGAVVLEVLNFEHMDILYEKGFRKLIESRVQEKLMKVKSDELRFKLSILLSHDPRDRDTIYQRFKTYQAPAQISSSQVKSPQVNTIVKNANTNALISDGPPPYHNQQKMVSMGHGGYGGPSGQIVSQARAPLSRPDLHTMARPKVNFNTNLSHVAKHQILLSGEGRSMQKPINSQMQAINFKPGPSYTPTPITGLFKEQSANPHSYEPLNFRLPTAQKLAQRSAASPEMTYLPIYSDSKKEAASQPQSEKSMTLYNESMVVNSTALERDPPPHAGMTDLLIVNSSAGDAASLQGRSGAQHKQDSATAEERDGTQVAGSGSMPQNSSYYQHKSRYNYNPNKTPVESLDFEEREEPISRNTISENSDKNFLDAVNEAQNHGLACSSSSSQNTPYGGSAPILITSYELNETPERRPSKRHNSTIKEVDENSYSDSKDEHSLTEKNTMMLVEEEYEAGRYEGEKRNGLRNGFGKFYYKEGSVYEGEWKNNQMHGRGTLYYQSGKIAYEGQWKEDEFHGFGKVYSEEHVLNKPGGSCDYTDLEKLDDFWVSYEGDLNSDRRHGKGKIKFSNGEIFTGTFINDMAEGQGKFFLINGAIVSGLWKQNMLMERYKQHDDERKTTNFSPEA